MAVILAQKVDRVVRFSIIKKKNKKKKDRNNEESRQEQERQKVRWVRISEEHIEVQYFDKKSFSGITCKNKTEVKNRKKKDEQLNTPPSFFQGGYQKKLSD